MIGVPVAVSISAVTHAPKRPAAFLDRARGDEDLTRTA
jgi:hypothetical protein